MGKWDMNFVDIFGESGFQFFPILHRNLLTGQASSSRVAMRGLLLIGKRRFTLGKRNEAQ